MSEPESLPDRPTVPGADGGDGHQVWPHRLTDAVAAEPDPRAVAWFDLTARVRLLIEDVVATEADEATLRAAASQVDELRAALESEGRRSIHATSADGDPDVHSGGFLAGSPFIGLANPLAPPIHITSVAGNEVRATVRFGSAYEGPPAHVHGGFVAAAFDEVLGTAQTLSGQSGMTGGLEIRYRAPTPLHHDLDVVGRVDRVEGRKIFTTGELLLGDRLCAEATAIFIVIDFAAFAQKQFGGDTA